MDEAFIESFNSRFRQECLNERLFLSLEDAKEKVGAWRSHYNKQRPHSRLGYQSPV
jgi:putative transposase